MKLCGCKKKTTTQPLLICRLCTTYNQEMHTQYDIFSHYDHNQVELLSRKPVTFTSDSERTE